MENYKYYVYFHIRKDTNKVCYIGKGKNKRVFDKERNAHHDRIVKKYGVETLIFKGGLNEKQAFELEKDLIYYFVFALDYGIDIEGYKKPNRKSHHLTNMTWGGEGVSRILTKAEKQHLSELNSGKNNAMYGKNCEDFMTPEAVKLKRQRKSEDMKKNNPMKNVDFSGKNNPMYGKTKTEECVNNISKNLKKYYKDMSDIDYLNYKISLVKSKSNRCLLCLETNEIFLNRKSAKIKYGGAPDSVANGLANKTINKNNKSQELHWEFISLDNVDKKYIIFDRNNILKRLIDTDKKAS